MQRAHVPIAEKLVERLTLQRDVRTASLCPDLLTPRNLLPQSFRRPTWQTRCLHRMVAKSLHRVWRRRVGHTACRTPCVWLWVGGSREHVSPRSIPTAANAQKRRKHTGFEMAHIRIRNQKSSLWEPARYLLRKPWKARERFHW